MFMVTLAWFLYFLVCGFVYTKTPFYITYLLALTMVCILTLVAFTFTKKYHRHVPDVSVFAALVLASLSLVFLSVAQLEAGRMPSGYFAVCVQVLVLVYALLPLKLYVCIGLGAVFSVTFEIASAKFGKGPSEGEYNALQIVVIKALTHLALHLIGLHIFLMSNVRMRSTFMRVGVSLLVRRQLELEKKLKENMIHSLIPKSIVERLIRDNDSNDKLDARRRSSQDTGNDIKSLFRPFNMSIKDNVSILFADICGFTKMSSNKSAEELVDILNNLFQRFDLICKQNNCEKISTLGDCYYCISGCPDDNKDHAKNCVEMGLHMVEAIKEYDNEKNQGINMRVGIHTGKVLFGIVGTRRFKFDVWSNDVTLANRMESTGKPGMVHISEKTLKFLDDQYLTEDAEPVFGLQTYFILGRKSDRTPSYSGSFRAEGRQKYTNSLQLYVPTPTDVRSLTPNAHASMSPQTRPRVLSCDTSATYSKHLDVNHDPNLLSPGACKIKASSLPSILDTEIEGGQEGSEAVVGVNGRKNVSNGKYSVKKKNWKIPRFIRKTSEQRNEGETDVVIADGGYQQVPTIIESGHNAKKKESVISVPDQSEGEDQSANIDIKSYISQSRSDMLGLSDYSPGVASDFIRVGSYRSQYGRPTNNDFAYLNRANSNRSRRGRSPSQFDGSFEPTERARSATVVLGACNFSFNRPLPKRSLDISSKMSSNAILDDNSIGNSRKDSGIRSNSRRSSIQQPDSTLNSDLLQHRVSGYYTSSQSTVNSPIGPNSSLGKHEQVFKNGHCIKNLRKQSDRQLIKCVQDNSKSQSNYFIKPPLSQITLFFKDRAMEESYRAHVHSIQENDTLSDSKYNTYLDVFVSTIVFICVTFELLALYGTTTGWIVGLVVLVCLQGLGIFLCLRRVISQGEVAAFTTSFFRWNLYGTVLVTLPMSFTLINYGYDKFTYEHLHLYSYVLFLSLVHFCNFTQVNCWVKNFVAIVCCVVLVALICNHFTVATDLPVTGLAQVNHTFDTSNFTTPSNNSRPKRSVEEDTIDLSFMNDTLLVEEPIPVVTDNEIAKQRNTRDSNKTITVTITNDYTYTQTYLPDMYINIFLLLVLVIWLNRELEIGYRLSFHANYVSNKDKINVESLKNQADYLIYNIVPEHVAEKLKKDAKYSENFKDIAIIFASIVNFNDLYDETFEGGIEFLRVLNELIADFDELLDRKEFQSVEKIKTIGSTFMAASGLNPEHRRMQRDKNEHLYELMEFALELQNVVNRFNEDLLEFNLILRVGYNIGDVTAAVIGNTKLYYDIWGDSVNIASRMDSTGVNGRIQVGERCLEYLDKRYEFESRGPVYVKGKDNMNCYLLKRRRTSDFLCVPET
ncbi:adenylate cyclase type 9 isoform X2 [Aethina tumida]|nr:adenylate cyclase type 9 isoform X2 [Aethina tumida]